MSCNGVQLCIYTGLYSSLLAGGGTPLNLKGLLSCSSSSVFLK